jgi:(E)-4-hydroxy-3-methylbut-2-enyl-diphosphate synthase
MALVKWLMLILAMWGSGPGKITLYKGKEVVKRNVDSNIAVQELVNILKENAAWVDA